MDARTEAKEQSTAQRAPQAPPCTMVIFGAGGDLTKRLLIPAIYNLAKDKLLSDNFAIVAADRTPKPAGRLSRLSGRRGQGALSRTPPPAATTEPFDAKTWDLIASRITHFAGDFTTPETYARARRPAQNHRGPVQDRRQRPVLPRRRRAIVRHDRRAARRGRAGTRKSTAVGAASSSKSRLAAILPPPRRSTPASSRYWTSRRSSAWTISSARRRSRTSWRCASRTRSSSRCGTATISITCRSPPPKPSGSSAAPISTRSPARCATWCRTMCFSCLSLTAMESPNSFAADAVRNEKTKVLEAVQPLDDEAVRRNVIRGQYAAGSMNGVSGSSLSAGAGGQTGQHDRDLCRACGLASRIGGGRAYRSICAPAKG